ncbi:MAG: sigma-70 family RNA polymerase sigma factor [Chlorobi bacterium]|nr:sigma-70 family RNA polymerase sigma factor [Chlorobiota bacterium]
MLLYRLACKMVNDIDSASDIVQEVFIYLHEKLQDGHQVNHLRGWLSKAVYNRCIDYLRKPKRNVGLKSLKNHSTENAALEVAETKTAINEALDKLNLNEKTLAILYSEGFSYKEMAEISGIKMSSIGTTLSRTLKKLKKELTLMGHELH